VEQVRDDDLVAGCEAAALREPDPEVAVGELGEARVEARVARSGAWPERTIAFSSSTTTAAPQTKSAFAASAASSWRRSFCGAQRSSSSRNATQGALARAIPMLRARLTPCCSSRRTTRTRSSRRRPRMDSVSSVDASSTTISSTVTPCWPSTAATQRGRYEARFLVGTTTVTSATLSAASPLRVRANADVE
jgi:hypothetical protein